MLFLSWQKVKKMTQDFIKAVMIWLMSWFPAPTPPVVHVRKQFGVTIGPAKKQKARTTMPPSTAPASLATAFVDDEKVFVKLSPGVDSKGAPATLKSVPQWTSSDETVVTVSAVAEDGTTLVTDGMSGWLVGGAPGSAVVKITAEGDVTPGVDPLELDIAVAVAGGDPTSLGAVIAAQPVKQ